jgi:coproporphyrinogen III oxidase
MSLPPEVRWVYDPRFADGSEEAQLASWLRPQDWLGVAAP